jgi:hypothetical protein
MEDGVESGIDRLDGLPRSSVGDGDPEGFEIEVASLDSPPQLRSAGPPGAPPRSPFAARLTPRRRILAALVAAGSVLLALVVISTSLPDARATLRRALHLPPAPTPATVFDNLLLDNTAPWGTLEIDGQAIAQDQLVSGLQYGYEAIHLLAGRHTLSYTAAHFVPLTCAISVPGRSDDTCPLAADAAPDTPELSGRRVLDLRASPDRLAQADLGQLVAAVDATLVTWTTQVAPGERYLAADRQPVVADRALTATLHLTVNTDSNRVTDASLYGSGACISLCSAGLGVQFPTRWTLLANVYLSWTFTESDGQLIASADGALALGQLTHLLPVLVSWQPGAWQVDARDLETAARVLFSALGDAIRQEWGAAPLGAEFPSGWTVLPFIAPNPADGAMIDIGTPSPIDGVPTGDTIKLLYRFGVLLAVNDHAHRALPQLPVATVADLEQWRGAS